MKLNKIVLLLVVLSLLFSSSIVNVTFAAGETSLGVGSTLTGTISSAGGENWYVINVTEAGNYTIKTSTSGTDFDTVMYLYDHTGAKDATTRRTQLMYDDDGAGGVYSQISYDLGKNTNFYVRVKCYYSDRTGSYKISLTKNSTFGSETGSTSFACFYGGDHKTDSNGNPSYYDVDLFYNAMNAKGWTSYMSSPNDHFGMISDLIGSKDYNLLYWSGHGLSNGNMSYYTSRSTSGYVSYDWSGKIMPSEIKNTYLYYGQNGLYYTDSQWSNKLNWVVLAACNQLTDYNTRNEWAKTMCGQHRVKGLMGYQTTAPVAPTDDNIITKFIDLSFNSTSKRPLFAWIQANLAYGKSDASCIYHTINEGDTLTNITANSIYKMPVFKYMWLSGSTTYTDDTPFDAPPSASSTSLRSTNLLAVEDTSLPEFESEVMFENEETLSMIDDKTVKEKFADLKYNIADEKNVVENVTKHLKGKELPDDAKLHKVYTISKADFNERENTAPKNAKVAGYMLQYRHKFNGTAISSNANGDYVNVFVDNEGIYSIEKKWSKVTKNVSKTSQKNTELLGKEAAKDKVKEYLNKNANIVDKDSYTIKDMELVYARKGLNDKIFVPAWEVTFDNGSGCMQINASTGELIQ